MCRSTAPRTHSALFQLLKSRSIMHTDIKVYILIMKQVLLGVSMQQGESKKIQQMPLFIYNKESSNSTPNLTELQVSSQVAQKFSRRMGGYTNTGKETTQGFVADPALRNCTVSLYNHVRIVEWSERNSTFCGHFINKNT